MKGSFGLLDLFGLISQRIDRDNAKDGVELILQPHHQFRCLKCKRCYTLRYDAEHCSHEELSENPLVG